MRTRRDTIKTSNVTLGCIGLLVAMIVLYLYFLNMSVVQVVMRTENIQKQSHLHTEIAQLEALYIESQHVIASRIGMSAKDDSSAEKVFVSREQASLVLGN
jgi:hypothetical protein